MIWHDLTWSDKIWYDLIKTFNHPIVKIGKIPKAFYNSFSLCSSSRVPVGVLSLAWKVLLVIHRVLHEKYPNLWKCDKIICFNIWQMESEYSWNNCTWSFATHSWIALLYQGMCGVGIIMLDIDSILFFFRWGRRERKLCKWEKILQFPVKFVTS